MIVARGGDGEKDFVLMILEPANLAKLQLGQPIVKSLNEFIPELTTKIDLLLAWCPDVGYLEERVKSGIGLVDALKDAMTRAEVFNARASAMGKQSISASLGRNGAAKGPKGGWLVLSEIGDDLKVKAVGVARVDGKKIKADTYYQIKSGKFVKAE